jgi:hypothetical protein
VPAGTAGLQVAGRFVGLGLRGNASAPMSVAVEIPAASRPFEFKDLAVFCDVPVHRQWVVPHLDGYKPLFAAVEEQGVDPRW